MWRWRIPLRIPKFRWLFVAICFAAPPPSTTGLTSAPECSENVSCPGATSSAIRSEGSRVRSLRISRRGASRSRVPGLERRGDGLPGTDGRPNRSWRESFGAAQHGAGAARSRRVAPNARDSDTESSTWSGTERSAERGTGRSAERSAERSTERSTERGPICPSSPRPTT